MQILKLSRPGSATLPPTPSSLLRRHCISLCISYCSRAYYLACCLAILLSCCLANTKPPVESGLGTATNTSTFVDAIVFTQAPLHYLLLSRLLPCTLTCSLAVLQSYALAVLQSCCLASNTKPPAVESRLGTATNTSIFSDAIVFNQVPLH